jgi:hypothetical protein
MALGFLPWTNISDTFTSVPGAPVAVLPWDNRFALFATDDTGTVRCAGAYMQTGLMGTWAKVSIDFSGPPGAAVTAVPWAEAFAVCAVDSTGAVCTASGDPQNDLSPWTSVQSTAFATKPGSAVTILAAGSGVDLFAVDSAGAVCATAGGSQVMTAFDPCRHGWHFNNDFANDRLFGVIPLTGLCGGMAYTSLDYYFLGMPIPTHRDRRPDHRDQPRSAGLLPDRTGSPPQPRPADQTRRLVQPAARPAHRPAHPDRPSGHAVVPSHRHQPGADPQAQPGPGPAARTARRRPDPPTAITPAQRA